MKMVHYRRVMMLLLAAALLLPVLLTGCGEQKETVLIYTSAEDYVVEDMTARLEAAFPQYDIIIEYLSTGNHGAKLLAEGTHTECDITYNLEYGYLEPIAQAGILADLSDYDMQIYCEDVVRSNFYIPQVRSGSAIILNTEVMAQRGLAEPTCYQDLLKPEYAGLISMPNPKSSGTGYTFLKSLVNAWGEDAAFAYFDQLTPNILQYTSSGSGPVNALLQGEVAIGLGMLPQAVLQLNQGAALKILFFEEGAPFALCGQGIVSGKENRQCVKEVFDFLVNTYGYEYNEKFVPEQLFRDKTFTVENYPQNIVYADMSGDTAAEKERLLNKWNH